ncbi:MAG: hypothetical protein QNK03_12235 [Myxococcota bacterium]|nr:hypothetical protein [Myxococcota bacterium]
MTTIQPLRTKHPISKASIRLLATALLAATGCATDLGTGPEALEDLSYDYPITVGRLVEARMDTKDRLRVYLSICHDAGATGPVCASGGLRMLAIAEAKTKRVLERLAERYLIDGAERPVYVYGPICEGMQEMILVPRCQLAMAIGVWDPGLDDYIVYSTMHGEGALIDSEGFKTFIDLTGRAAGLARKSVF